jgi:branched-chain amino acid transport system substrate-binding protein
LLPAIPPDPLPGVRIDTSATDLAPLSQWQLMKLGGETWERSGDIVGANAGG